MKAAVYQQAGPPSVFTYKDVPEPLCGDDQVLIEVEAIAVEGGDLFYRRGVTPPHPDYIVGFSAAGKVVKKGSGVSNLQLGDRVATFDLVGAYATVRAVPARTAWRIPDALDMVRASAIPVPYLTAHLCLEAAAVGASDTILLHAGGSMLGIACLQLAKRKGARVLCIVAGMERASRLKELGADAVIDRDREDIVGRTQGLTHGRGASIAIDAVGGSTLDMSISALANFGRLIFVGNASGLPMTPDLWPAMRKNLQLTGVYLGDHLDHGQLDPRLQSFFQEAASQSLEVVIDRQFPLSAAAEAHEYLERNKVLGRIVLIPS